MKEVMAQTGLTDTALKHALVEHGIPVRPRGNSKRIVQQGEAPRASAPVDDGPDEGDAPSETVERKGKRFRVTKSFAVEEPPEIVAAPVDALDRLKAARDAKVAKAAKAAEKKAGKAAPPPWEAVDDDDEVNDEGQGEVDGLNDMMDAYEAGCTDDGHVSRMMTLASRLHREGTIPAKQYADMLKMVKKRGKATKVAPKAAPAKAKPRRQAAPPPAEYSYEEEEGGAVAPLVSAPQKLKGKALADSLLASFAANNSRR